MVELQEVWLVNVDIDGMIANVKINGVDVTPYVTAELQRTNPERALLQPTDAAGMRVSWREVSARWDAIIERAERTSPISTRSCSPRPGSSSRTATHRCRRVCARCSKRHWRTSDMQPATSTR